MKSTTMLIIVIIIVAVLLIIWWFMSSVRIGDTVGIGGTDLTVMTFMEAYNGYNIYELRPVLFPEMTVYSYEKFGVWSTRTFSSVGYCKHAIDGGT